MTVVFSLAQDQSVDQYNSIYQVEEEDNSCDALEEGVAMVVLIHDNGLMEGLKDDSIHEEVRVWDVHEYNDSHCLYYFVSHPFVKRMYIL